MVRILGGGPAGAAAAITALGEGAEVELYEQSRVPRHKVCGEFLSPETRPALERLGVLEECAHANPARIARFVLHVGSRRKRGRLPEPAWGLSRYRLDHILLNRAAALGARILRERRTQAEADVVTSGRPGVVARLDVDHTPADALLRRMHPGARIRHDRPFGFKAHFRGPCDDAVELFFFQFGYVGVSAIEDGLTNVCGLAYEHLLRERGFEPDALLASRPELAERLHPLSRAMDWLFTGPVTDSEDFAWRKTGPYLAGDALGSPPPFTGTGILAALLTGSLAGRAAARTMPPAAYFREAEKVLGRAFLFASAFSAAIDIGLAPLLAPLVPAGWLFRLTRPNALASAAPRS